MKKQTRTLQDLTPSMMMYTGARERVEMVVRRSFLFRRGTLPTEHKRPVACGPRLIRTGVMPQINRSGDHSLDSFLDCGGTLPPRGKSRLADDLHGIGWR